MSAAVQGPRIVVKIAGSGVINGQYAPRPAAVIPKGFADVCVAQGWSTASTWSKLNRGTLWWEHDNGSYIYLNNSDRKWWIDGPEGYGLYIAPEQAGSMLRDIALPPLQGWSLLSAAAYPAPILEVQDV